jgi:hypothetical protein
MESWLAPATYPPAGLHDVEDLAGFLERTEFASGTGWLYPALANAVGLSVASRVESV